LISTLAAYFLSFLMAFLLFVVQPMASKILLPQFGGTPAVWNTVMLCFQALLLLGYLYAHLLTTYVSPRYQRVMHLLLLVLVLFFLPVGFHPPTAEVISDQPVRSLLIQLLGALGLPFVFVAATAPLLQRWVSVSCDPMATKPYVLYSASNLGSFSALLGYLLVIEPRIPLSQQTHLWSLLLIVAAVGLLIFAWRLLPKKSFNTPASHAPSTTAEEAITWRWREVDWGVSCGWLLLAFLPSGLSLGLTTHMTTDIASVPFFWVAPLAIYLLSFVDAFASRPIFVPLAKRLAPFAALVGMFLLMPVFNGFTWLLLVHILVFMTLAFALHGYLADRKPSPEKLTWYYLCIAFGGMLGGVFNALIAPNVLDYLFEYPALLWLAAIVSFILSAHYRPHAVALRQEVKIVILHALQLGVLAMVVAVFLAYVATREISWAAVLNAKHAIPSLVLAAIILRILTHKFHTLFYGVALVSLVAVFMPGDAIHELRQRNFFGVSYVYRDAAFNARVLVHGTTLHGLQSLDPAQKLQIMSYYNTLEEVMRARTPAVASMPLGIIGLGIGVVKCFAAPQQQIDFFEINPLVVAIAKNQQLFTYLSDCPGQQRIILGDGRLTLARETDHRYGILVIDAFSSDAIPVHLLTREALQLYFSKLDPNGILAIHISNRHLDLYPLLAALAKEEGVAVFSKRQYSSIKSPLLFDSDWVVLIRPSSASADFFRRQPGWKIPEFSAFHHPWTDDYTNLLPYLKVLR
jgi:hypothetical protein